MRVMIFKGLAFLIGMLYFSTMLLTLAMAEGPKPFGGAIRVAAEEPFVLPPQEEGKLELPPAVSKPWYKKWWVWTIVVAVAGGAAAAAGGGGGGGGGGDGGSSTGNIAVDW